MLSLGTIAAKIFGTSNDRRLKSFKPKVAAINALEPEVSTLSDADLRARTAEFRKQLAEGADIDSLLIPAFATVREAAKRAADDHAYLNADGKIGEHLKRGDRLVLRRSAHTLNLIRPPRLLYFDVLRQKLKWGER